MCAQELAGRLSIFAWSRAQWRSWEGGVANFPGEMACLCGVILHIFTLSVIRRGYFEVRTCSLKSLPFLYLTKHAFWLVARRWSGYRTKSSSAACASVVFCLAFCSAR